MPVSQHLKSFPSFLPSLLPSLSLFLSFLLIINYYCVCTRVYICMRMYGHATIVCRSEDNIWESSTLLSCRGRVSSFLSCSILADPQASSQFSCLYFLPISLLECYDHQCALLLYPAFFTCVPGHGWNSCLLKEHFNLISHVTISPSPIMLNTFIDIYLTYYKSHSLKLCNSGSFKVYSQIN